MCVLLFISLYLSNTSLVRFISITYTLLKMAYARVPWAVVKFTSDQLTDVIKTSTIVNQAWDVDDVVDILWGLMEEKYSVTRKVKSNSTLYNIVTL